MTRYFVEIQCRIVADDPDSASDMLMDALLVEPGLIDVDLTAELSTGSVTITSAVDADEEPGALMQALIGVRSAAHGAGAGTATWDTDLKDLVASVRPYVRGVAAADR